MNAGRKHEILGSKMKDRLLFIEIAVARFSASVPQFLSGQHGSLSQWIDGCDLNLTTKLYGGGSKFGQLIIWVEFECLILYHRSKKILEKILIYVPIRCLYT